MLPAAVLVGTSFQAVFRSVVCWLMRFFSRGRSNGQDEKEIKCIPDCFVQNKHVAFCISQNGDAKGCVV